MLIFLKFGIDHHVCFVMRFCLIDRPIIEPGKRCTRQAVVSSSLDPLELCLALVLAIAATGLETSPPRALLDGIIGRKEGGITVCIVFIPFINVLFIFIFYFYIFIYLVYVSPTSAQIQRKWSVYPGSQL
jgi:hypothetical protein